MLKYPPIGLRLAEDVLSPKKLEEYQTTYAEQIKPFRLESEVYTNQKPSTAPIWSIIRRYSRRRNRNKQKKPSSSKR